MRSRSAPKERLVRTAVFFLMVVITCACAGALMSNMKLTRTERHRPIVLAVTAGCVAFSYLSAYRPGWAYNYLTGAGEEE
jgi:hypothetical protein